MRVGESRKAVTGTNKGSMSLLAAAPEVPVAVDEKATHRCSQFLTRRIFEKRLDSRRYLCRFDSFHDHSDGVFKILFIGIDTTPLHLPDQSLKLLFISIATR